MDTGQVLAALNTVTAQANILRRQITSMAAAGANDNAGHDRLAAALRRHGINLAEHAGIRASSLDAAISKIDADPVTRIELKRMVERARAGMPT
jgi:hypothetical protein